MKKKAFGMVALFLFISFFTGSAFAGQVVTKELSQWASQAIANEQALSVVPSSKSVAVFYYQNLTGDASFNPLQKGLSVMLTTDLAKVKDLKVVERAQLQAILEEIELGTTGLVDTETVPRVGRLVGARFLSGGEILKGSITQLQVDPSLLDVPEQITINQASAEGDLNDLIAIEKEILFETIRLMDVALTPDQKAELEKPISASIPALMLLFKGIDASDHGNYTQAAELYEQALAKDPNLTPAKEALNEINTLELTSKEPISKSADTVKAKQPAPSPEPAVTAAKSGGFLKYTAIGLGLAAAGAGGYYLATADKDDDKEPSPAPPPPSPAPTPPSPAPTPPSPAPTPPSPAPTPPSDTESPTITLIIPNLGISCSGSTIKIFFSESIDLNRYEVTYSPDSWGISNIYWKGENFNSVLVIETSNSPRDCEDYNDNYYTPPPIDELTFTLRNFYDLAGNPLKEEYTVISFHIIYD